MQRTHHRFALAALFLAWGAVPCTAQDDEKIPDNPAIEEKLDALEEVLKDKKAGRDNGARDDEAVALIDELLQLSRDGVSDGDFKDLIKGFGKVYQARPVRDPQNLKIYRAVSAALGEIGGPQAAIVMRKVYEGKRPFPDDRDYVNMREALLKAIGKTKDPASAKFLYDIGNRAHEDALKAAAGEALGNYDEAPFKLRAEILNKMLIEFGRQESLATPIDPGNQQAQNARATLRAISDRWMTTMSKLTGQNFRSFQDWNTWYNKNKAKPDEWK